MIETNEIPSLLESWKDRKNLEKEWEMQLARSSCKNQWENPVPEEWNHVSFWFANGETIRKNDYNLTAGRYKPVSYTHLQGVMHQYIFYWELFGKK